jgi:hypothetical protein
MGLRGQPEPHGICEVGADGDFTRYQGSMHEVHDREDRVLMIRSIWVVPQVHFVLLSLRLEETGVFLLPENKENP